MVEARKKRKRIRRRKREEKRIGEREKKGNRQRWRKMVDGDEGDVVCG